jgi:transglutaminase-like putative cysteine protease
VSDTLTAHAIEQWVQSNIEYESGYYYRGINYALQHRKGDCTEMAEIIVRLCELDGVFCRTVHGYGTWRTGTGAIETFKHDWAIARIKTFDTVTGAATKNSREQRLDGVPDCLRYEQTGEGIW